jgi:hypothetical protein
MTEPQPETLTADERRLIKDYRRATPARRRWLFHMAFSMGNASRPSRQGASPGQSRIDDSQDPARTRYRGATLRGLVNTAQTANDSQPRSQPAGLSLIAGPDEI